MKKTLLLICALIVSVGMAWAQDPSSGSSTTETGNVPYTWTFTQNGTSVTVLFERTGDGSTSGFDDNARYIRVSKGNVEPTEVGAGNYVKTETNHGIAYTWTNCNEGDVLNAIAQWNCMAGAALTSKVSFTVGATGGGGNTPDVNLNPATPATTADASLVYNVFSDDYSTSHLDEIQNVSAGTEASVKTINGGGHVYQISNSTNFDIKFTGGDVPVLNTEGHIAVYPTENCTLTITPLFYADSGTKSFNYNATANQWNYISFNPQEYFTDDAHKAQHYILRIAGMDSKTIYFDDLYYVRPLEEPAAAPVDVPTPSLDAEQVFNIYSDKYGTTSTTKTGDWTMTEETINSKKTIKVEKFVWNSFSFAATDLSAYTKIHFDVYPVKEMPTIAIHVQGVGFDGYKTLNLTKGEWTANSFDLSLTDDLGLSADNIKAINNVLFNFNGANGDGTGAFYYGNIYFWSDAPSITLTATPGTSTLLLGGATTNISTTVTESGNDVTTSSTITYTSNNTDVIEVSNAGVVTAKGLGNTKVTVSATYNNITRTKDIDFTVLLPEQTPPTEDYNNVLVVFSNVYHQGNALDNTNPTYGRENSPFASSNIYTTVDYPAQENGHKVVHVMGAGVNGQTKKPTETSSGSANNMTNYYKVHFYVWPTHATKGEVFADNKYPTAKASFSGLTPGQWNPVTVNIDARATAFGEKNYIVVYFMQEDGTMETEFYLDHFYLSKLNDSEAIMTINGNVANVIGSVTESYLTTLNTVTAQVLDLTGVTSYTATSAIETTNPNTLIFIPGTAGDSFTPTFTIANTKNVIGKDGYNFPITPIEYIDIPQYQPWAGTINNFSKYGQSYTVKREIAANKYVTTCLPMSFVIPEGLSVYALDVENSTTSSVKFNKITEGIVANSPYILHNYTDSPVQLEASRTTGDFNLSSETAGTINFASTATFKGNYSEISGDGTTMYGLSGSTGAAPVFRPIGTGAKIGAYRAYFTGLTAAATARFFDGETTKIGTINANGEIEVGTVYNLAGQRVQNPTKGIYIINGKKVVLK